MTKIIGTETVGKGVKLAGVGYDKVVDKAMRSLKIYQELIPGSFYLLQLNAPIKR